MPSGYTFQVFKRLCAQRERYRRGLLHEQTMDSLRLRFGRYLYETDHINEWGVSAYVDSELQSVVADGPGGEHGLGAGAGPDL